MRLELFPFINSKGEFSEQTVDRSYSHWSMAKPPVQTSVVFSKGNKPPDESVTVQKEIFEKKEFGFQIDDTRRVWVKCFISEEFKREVEPDFRMKAIEYYIRDMAPWIFSYGTREIRK